MNTDLSARARIAKLIEAQLVSESTQVYLIHASAWEGPRSCCQWYVDQSRGARHCTSTSRTRPHLGSCAMRISRLHSRCTLPARQAGRHSTSGTKFLPVGRNIDEPSEKIIKGVLILLGLWLVIGVGLIAYRLAGANDRVTAVCESIKPGTNVEQLAVMDDKKGLRFKPAPMKDAEVVYLPETRSGGRYGCRIRLHQDVVKEATTYHVD